jgi:hypothetical protein
LRPRVGGEPPTDRPEEAFPQRRAIHMTLHTNIHNTRIVNGVIYIFGQLLDKIQFWGRMNFDFREMAS